MKKIILMVLVLIMFLAFPLLSQASYIIYLKDGGQFLTARYWAEGDEIKFEVSGGVMGIDKADVKKIVESEEEILDDSYKTKKSIQPSESVETKPETELVKPDEKDKKTEAKEGISDDPNKNPDIMNKYRQLRARYEGRNGLTIDELQMLRNELVELRDRIYSNNLSDSHEKEKIDLNDMQFRIRSLIIRKTKER